MLPTQIKPFFDFLTMIGRRSKIDCMQSSEKSSAEKFKYGSCECELFSFTTRECDPMMLLNGIVDVCSASLIKITLASAQNDVNIRFSKFSF